MTDSAQETWKSMYTDELYQIWQSERKELRRAAMIVYVLKLEFDRIEAELNLHMKNFKQRYKFVKDFNESEERDHEMSANTQLKTQLVSPDTHNLVSTNDDSAKEMQLHKSPKINRHRKIARAVKPPPSPSLLDIQKENKIHSVVLPKKQFARKSSAELFDSSMETSPITALGENRSETLVKKGTDELFSLISKYNPVPFYKENQNSSPIKSKLQLKKCEAADLVDSSVLISDIADTSIRRKLKRSKSGTLKRSHNKIIKNRKKKDCTLTQMFLMSPTQLYKSEKETAKTRNLKSPDFAAGSDETFFSPNCENNQFFEVVESKQCKKNVSASVVEDYDKFPETKNASPKYVHRTEVVRCKGERMKLPGWACFECEQFYEALDLPPEKLQQKMNACSRHRNKFQPLNETPEGFWDITMSHTQKKTPTDDTVFM